MLAVPTAALGNILGFLPINDVRALACSSHAMNQGVNSDVATKIFLKAFSISSKCPLEHSAALFDNSAARKILLEIIQVNGDEKAYNAIQKVYNLITFGRLSIRALDDPTFKYEFDEGLEYAPQPNPHKHQLKSGFQLAIDASPRFLATPFGQITLCGGARIRGYSQYSFSAWVIKRLRAVFESIAYYDQGRRPFHVVEEAGLRIKKITDADILEVPKDLLPTYVGSSNLINDTQYGNVSMYNPKALPVAVPFTEGEVRRSSKSIQKIWELLEQGSPRCDHTKALAVILWFMRFFERCTRLHEVKLV